MAGDLWLSNPSIQPTHDHRKFIKTSTGCSLLYLWHNPPLPIALPAAKSAMSLILLGSTHQFLEDLHPIPHISFPHLPFVLASSSYLWVLKLSQEISAYPCQGWLCGFMSTVCHSEENTVMYPLTTFPQLHCMMNYHQIFNLYLHFPNCLINNLKSLFESRSKVHTLQNNT